MKIQDIVFVVVLLVLLYKARANWLVYAGLLSLVLCIPLFAAHIFFTAERLVSYAVGFLFVSVIVHLYMIMKEK